MGKEKTASRGAGGPARQGTPAPLPASGSEVGKDEDCQQGCWRSGKTWNAGTLAGIGILGGKR